jgi:hypothetical protein
MSSGRAGRVVPAGFFPLLPGDSASGKVALDIKLRGMPRPLLNAVFANVQAWVVPKQAYPRFAGTDEVLAALGGGQIKAHGQPTRNPPPFFELLSASETEQFANSDFARTLGLHIPDGMAINTELIDAYALIWNFRAAAHSSKLDLRPYASDDISTTAQLRRAFWPSSQFAHVVPDYERALVVGALDLDVLAGSLPLSGVAPVEGITQTSNGINPGAVATTPNYFLAEASQIVMGGMSAVSGSPIPIRLAFERNAGQTTGTDLNIRAILNGLSAEMAGRTVSVTLAEIDKAREAQAFAQLRTAYAGNDSTGYTNDDAIVALLMQGLAVDQDQFKRPILLDSKRVPINMVERFATDSANLEDSFSEGIGAATLSLNIPTLKYGGMVVYTIEVLPERLHERMFDEYLTINGPDKIPNALRDTLREEPVDLVANRRVDAAHNNPHGIYGYEPMNYQWMRNFTRLGGQYYEANPLATWTEKRNAIWYVNQVNPVLGESHYLAPSAFPHTVFNDTQGPAFDFVARHSVTIAGLTQMGDPLAEDNNDYEAIQDV